MNRRFEFIRTVVFPAAILTTCLFGCGAVDDSEPEASQVTLAERVRRACTWDSRFRCTAATQGQHSGPKIRVFWYDVWLRAFS
jgi:hypothetical protein